MVNIFRKARYISSVSIVYGITLLLLWSGFNPFILRLFPVAEAHQTNQVVKPPQENSTDFEPKAAIVRSGVPKSISIPNLPLDKEVLPGIYDSSKGTWNLSDVGVHYAYPSVPLNDFGGNTLLYAHNNRLAFGRLYLLKKGDKALMHTDNGYLFTYTYVSSRDYQPEDTSIFTYQGPPTLTLQTCTGYFNETRRLYSFTLDSVEKL